MERRAGGWKSFALSGPGGQEQREKQEEEEEEKGSRNSHIELLVFMLTKYPIHHFFPLK